MKLTKLLERLRTAGVRLSVAGPDRLKVSAPPGALDDEIKAALRVRKSELIRLLSSAAESEAPIPARNPDAALALSPNQARLWSLAVREPESARFNLPFALRLRGALNVEALRTALRQIVDRHEVLRTKVVPGYGEPHVAIAETANPLVVEKAPPYADESWLEKRLGQESAKPLDLGSGTCVRTFLVELDSDHYVLLLITHHLVSDGASFEVIFAELGALYSAAAAGSPSPLPPLPLQFFDVAAWQHEELASPRAMQAEKFWTDVFTPPPNPLDFPQADPHAPAHRSQLPLPTDVARRLREFAVSEATSPFVIAVAVYATMISRMSGSRDVVLCTPSSGRNRDEVHGMVGYFNNVVPLRLAVGADATLRETIRATRQRVLDAQANELLPLQRIASLPATTRLPLTRGMFAFHGTPLALPRLEGLEVEAIEVATGTADFDVGVSILPFEDGLRCTVEYREGVLGSTSGDAFLRQYVGLLDSATQHPDNSPDALFAARSVAAPGSKGSAGSGSHSDDEARWTREPSEVVLAGDPLELQLTLIWEHALGIRPIAPDDNFFQLGGHSLLAVQILETIEREVGARLTLGALVDAPTVTELAGAVRSLGWRPASGCLVPMDVRAEGDPLIFLHSFEGHTFIFHELVRQFGGRVPSYGLQAVGLGDNTPPHRTVEEMAEHYLEELDRHFGSAPVTLVGMCFGFSISLEMAARRAAQGNPVRLILIDGAWDHLRPGNEIGGDVPLITHLKRRLRRNLERGKWALDGVRRRMTTSAYARREAAIRRRTVAAWYAYHPRPHAGGITLIRAQETANDPERAWQLDAMESIAGDGLKTVIVPGHHFTILRDPHVVELAEQVLRAAGARALAGSDGGSSPPAETF